MWLRLHESYDNGRGKIWTLVSFELFQVPRDLTQFPRLSQTEELKKMLELFLWLMKWNIVTSFFFDRFMEMSATGPFPGF